MLPRPRISILLVLAVLVPALLAVSCAPAAQPASPAAPAASADTAKGPEKTAPQSAAAQPAGEQPAAAGDGQQLASADTMSGVRPSPYQAGRKIIKDGQMNLLVANTDQAIDQITTIAVDSGGYVLSTETALKDGAKTATMKLGVPVDRFEDVQRRVRATALQVLNEIASGQDVSDEFVDLQARLTNLQATEARVREFLDKAQSVEESLKVNQQLSEIEGEIEKVKGRMSYLNDRAAFSTLTVNIEPNIPTPTPTPTATPAPVIWQPGKTFGAAGSALGTVLRTLGDIAIWAVVLFGPFVVAAAVLIFLITRLRPRGKGGETPPPAKQAPRPEETGTQGA